MPRRLRCVRPSSPSHRNAAPAAAAAVEAAPVPNKGDTAFMFLSTILVLFMIIPGLGLFYGGLVRAKNMLSVLMQCTVVACSVMIIWVLYGYSFAFGGATNAFFGGTAKMFLAGVDATTTAATFTKGVVIPEYILCDVPDDIRCHHASPYYRCLC